MPATTSISVDRHRLGDVLSAELDRLIDTWEGLGAGGPSCGSPVAGPPAMARARYLHPLARALVGALRGSTDHAALYFDERLRYVDRDLPPAQLRAALRQQMAIEFPAIAAALADELPDALTADGVEQQFWDFHEPLLNPPDAANRVLFIGDCVFVETRAFLAQRRAESGRPVDVRHVFFSTRQPVAAVNTAIVNEVQRHRPDVIGLSLFTFEGVPPYTYAWRKAALPFVGARTAGIAEGLVELVRETIADIRTVCDATVAVHVPCGLPLDRLRHWLPFAPVHSRAQRRLLQGLARGLQELAASVENVVLLDEAALAGELGGTRAAAAFAFAEDDVPPGYSHTTALGPALARYYDELLSDYDLVGKAKALLVDFDNTLWNGVMAEGDVVHNTDGQRLLLELKNAGVLLVALSKNDESSIRWDQLVLSEDDFVLKKINWLPKADNVSAVIKQLDLAADAFVMLDDNPVERALVTEMEPGVRALDPANQQAWRTLRRWLAFPSTRQTQEARRRTVMYREAAERRAAMSGSGSHDYGAMMKTLGLRCGIGPAASSDLARVLELIERTNQFNTTTRRRTAAQVRELLDSPDWLVYVASLRDRFGDLGVVAVAIFDKTERVFDSVIMSCRAMGFGVEFAVLRAVLDAAGPGAVRGLFVPTNRNGPAAEFFAQAQFQAEADGTWVLPPSASGPQVPPWLARE
jgi:FkbH-like protein